MNAPEQVNVETVHGLDRVLVMVMMMRVEEGDGQLRMMLSADDAAETEMIQKGSRSHSTLFLHVELL